MRTILTYFFVTLGVIFFLLILVVCYAWYANWWGVQTVATTLTASSPDPTETAPPGISVEQRQALEDAGIDASIFSNLSPEQTECLTEQLGSERVAAITEGAMPTFSEITAGAECL